MIFEIQRMGNSSSILLLSFYCKEFDIEFVMSKNNLFDALDVELEKDPMVKGVIINLEGINFMDDTISLFLSLLKYLFRKNKLVNVTGLSKNIKTIFELARMNRIIQWHTNLSEAEISLNDSPYPENTIEAKYYSFSNETKAKLGDDWLEKMKK